MVEVSQETLNKLEELAEEKGAELEDVIDEFKENYKEAEERSHGVSDELLEKLAFRPLRTAQFAKSRIPVNGVEMLTIGGSIQNWSNGDSFVGKALVDVDPNGSGNTFLSTVIASEEDVNLGKIRDAFSDVGNIVTGEFTVGEAHSEQFRMVQTTEDTTFEFTVPDDRSPMIEEIQDEVPEVTIENIPDNLSQQERTDDGEMRAASFGVDIRRITVDIFDGYKNPNKGTGAYTVRDDTVFSDEDIERSAVFDAENASENATPGLTCWTDPTMMEYGSESVCEFFGAITPNQDGIPTMNVDGIVPQLVKNDYDGYVDESDDEEVPEQTSSNVSRTSI